ncbi:amidohydrolase [Haloactinomyces albus]|uniref:Amidohydrolase YtcJ n=1 Tax=Haloactinomyces albus TaxID=1352928 RepID=A0AAE3ZGH8_9ACTN|nr:amidohydrolase [Haloactinomyces albus]MDR7303630.1 putative amidohydrolase YtcJ [Haloactinomyces albus]
MHADLLLTSATVHTLDNTVPRACDIAVANGKVLALGQRSDLDGYRGPDTDVRDMNGACVMPGLVDVHNHHSFAGKAELFELRLPEAGSLTDILDAVRAHAAGLGAHEWIIGGNWPSTLGEQLCHASARRALDEAAGGRAVMLTDDSKHNRWVSTAALELAGITTTTSAPESGQIVHDPATGELTGLLLEAAGIAVEHAVRATGGMSPQQYRQSCASGIAALHRYGVTTFQDAGVSVDIMRALAELDHAGQLPMWVVSSMLINDPIFGFEPTGADLLAQGENFRTDHHRPDFVKIFLDGVPPTRTAAFLEPYLPDDAHGSCHRGNTTISVEDLAPTLLDVARRGLSGKVHCTGDAAVRAVLDAAQHVRAHGYTEALIQIAHGQFVHPDDRPRLAELGVTADISPFLWTPGVIPSAIADVLPADRASQMQPNRTLIDSGALVAGGTDWPVSPSPNVWEGIQGLVTRRDPTGRYPGALWPEQALTLAEAISVFTINGARAIGLDAVTGSLTPGKSADFVVLDRDPFEVDVESVSDTTVLQTWFAGRQVYRVGD